MVGLVHSKTKEATPMRDAQQLFTEEHELAVQFPMSRINQVPIQQVAFFDIETTGMDGESDQMTVGGVAWIDGRRIQLEQFFVPTPDLEGEVLSSFFERLAEFACLCHYDGDRFSIPFLQRRAAKLGLTPPFGSISSVDWLLKAQQLQRALEFPDQKLSTVQEHLGFERRDQSDGAEMIRLYREWQRIGDKRSRAKMLLHNSDDVVLLMSAAATLQRLTDQI